MPPPTSLLLTEGGISSVPNSPIGRKSSSPDAPASEPNSPKSRRSNSTGAVLPLNQVPVELKARVDDKKPKKLGAIKLRLWYQEKGGVLHVYVLEGRDLASNKGGSANPYLKLLIAPDPQKKTRKKTSIVKKSLEPVWNEPFEYTLTLSALNFKCLRVKLMDHEPASIDTFVGSVEIQLASVCRVSDEAVANWYNIEPAAPQPVTSGVKIFSGKINSVSTSLFSKRGNDTPKSEVGTIISPKARKMMGSNQSIDASIFDDEQKVGTLRACVWHNSDTDTLHVEVFDCIGLAPQYLRGLGHLKRDPYVELKLIPQEDVVCSLKSKVIRKTLEPIFNEKFEFSIDRSKCTFKTLSISILDSDSFGDKLLGEVFIPLTDVPRNTTGATKVYSIMTNGTSAVVELHALKDLLCLEPGYKSFHSFLPEDSKDNLLFWRDVQEYRFRYSRADKDLRPGCMSECCELISRFFGAKAEYGVDVPTATRNQIDVALAAEKQTSDSKRGCAEFSAIFDDAQASVITSMTRDWFTSYLSSPQYSQFKHTLATEATEKELGFKVVNAIPEPRKSLGKVKLRLWYQEKGSVLHVYILEAHDIPRNKNGSASPYLRLILVEPEKESVKKTSVVKKSLEPVWNEPFDFSLQFAVLRATTLRVKLFDCDSAMETLIGVVEISLASVSQSGDEALANWFKFETETPGESVVDKLSSKVKLLRSPTTGKNNEDVSINSMSTDSNSSESFVTPEPMIDEKGIRSVDSGLSRGYGVIRACVWHDNDSLMIEIISCTSLSPPVQKGQTKRDAFVELQLHPAESGVSILRTKVVCQTLDPIFNEIFSLNVDKSKCALRTLSLTVKDYDSFGFDRSIGEALISLSDIPKQKMMKPYSLNAGANIFLELKSLDDLLKLEAGYKSFLSFLDGESMEMQFWREVQEYHHKYEYSSFQLRANCMAECCDLYTKYFGANAECEVEISGPIRHKLAIVLEEEKHNTNEDRGCEALSNIFAEAQAAVNIVFARNASSYFNSQQYAVLRDLLEDATEKTFGFRVHNMIPEPTRAVGELKLRMWYQEKKGLLYVYILEARGLYSKGGPASPFVEVLIAPDPQKKSRKKTPVVKKSTEPVWNAPFEYSLDLSALNFKTLQAEIRDANSDAFLGLIEIPLASVPRVGDDATPEWYPLSAQTEVASESVIASISAKVKLLRTKPIEAVAPIVEREDAVMSAKAMRMLGRGGDDAEEEKSLRKNAKAEYGVVRACVWHSAETEKLNVEVLECTDLPGKGRGQGKRDPYVELKLLPQDSQTTSLKSKVVRRTLDPIFNEQFEFSIERSKCTLKTLSLAILDYDAFGIRKIVGEVLISLSDVSRTQYGSTKLYSLTAGSTTVVEIKSLGDLLQLEVGYKAFLVCLTKEYSNENLVFWREIQEYQHKYRHQSKEQRPACMSECWELFTKYVAPGADNEINIPSATRVKVQKAIAEEKQTMDSNRGCEALASLFDDAKNDILILMTRDSFARFLNSPEYAELSAYLADEAAERELGFKVNNLISTIYNIPI